MTLLAFYIMSETSMYITNNNYVVPAYIYCTIGLLIKTSFVCYTDNNIIYGYNLYNTSVWISNLINEKNIISVT